MRRNSQFAFVSAFLAIGFVVTGCTQQEPGGQPSASPGVSSGQSAAESGEGLNQEKSVEGEHSAALAELSPEDRALAEKQKICPVSGEPLGSMGKPYKVTVEGQNVLLCCQGCEEEIKKDPQKYLAKIQ